MNENATISTYLAYITAKDGDFGKNGRTNVKIHSITTNSRVGNTAMSASKKTFTLTQNGFLSLNRTVDRETIDQYEIKIEACDFGTPSK